ncbi:MAG: polyprenyl synthetase family protein, partial [Bowdeniella nasicola]|nr:polyprenyl synthetase family protein [Bowdeniella nasicola]
MSREDQLREAITQRLAAILAQVSDEFASIHPAAGNFFPPASQLLQGGKRMRAILADAGYRCARQSDVLAPVIIEFGVALELFQAAALVHDDIIDDSDSRRGHPSAHVYFAGLSPSDRAHEATSFGRNGAILLGDLLIVLAE